jgi:DNA helicase-2/ATP-dependent DNA helicase PcrA
MERPVQNAAVLGLEDDEVGAAVVREELRLLEVVLAALDSAVAGDQEAARGRARDDALLLELRDEASAAKPEDLPSLFEQMHHIGALRAQRGRGQAGNIDRKSPYFAHLRLSEDGRRRDVLIGQRSWIEGKGVRIVDWRHAPISKVFYRYQEGDDYEEELGARVVEGAVLVRRTLAIKDGELHRVASPQGTFARGKDGRWKRVDARSAKLESGATEGARLGEGQIREDKLLPAIASMLDEAQYALITRPGAGLVVVQGSAGSGKTTVGLHRAAYLAFADPQRFRPERMMVVVPNEALLHYTARVLPELGVEGVPVTTFARWATRLVPDLYPSLPLRVSEETPPVVSRAKSHPAMLRAIGAAAARVEQEVDARLTRAMGEWPEGSRVLHAWTDTTGPADARLTALGSWLVGKRTLAGGTGTGLPEVTRGALEQLGHALRQRTRNLSALWDELLTGREVLATTFEGVAELGPGQLDQVHEWCVRQARVRAEGERDGEEPTLDAEDHALLLRLWQAVRGPLPDVAHGHRPLRAAHLFIDEVQDASPIELRVLLDLAGKEQSVTLAGDAAQRLYEGGDERGELDWAKLLDDLAVPHTTIAPLKVSYRSTAEITTFARGVLGTLAHESEPIATRSGPPVELFTFASAGEAVAFLADAIRELQREQPRANVALVARFAPHADVYYEGLVRAEVPRVRRVAKHDFTWEPGVDVTDVMQTKGLEFDEVVLLETTQTSYPNNPAARHALYVGATRAAHQLWCTASEAPSPIVAEALALRFDK